MTNNKKNRWRKVTADAHCTIRVFHLDCAYESKGRDSILKNKIMMGSLICGLFEDARSFLVVSSFAG
jgi:hypothetical protein